MIKRERFKPKTEQCSVDVVDYLPSQSIKTHTMISVRLSTLHFGFRAYLSRESVVINGKPHKQ
jgi:hypothetical protein